MLVLSRQRDETIMIGDEIEITVVDIRGDKVRLGITAPKAITVHRKEVYEAIRRESRARGIDVVPETHRQAEPEPEKTDAPAPPAPQPAKPRGRDPYVPGRGVRRK